MRDKIHNKQPLESSTDFLERSVDAVDADSVIKQTLACAGYGQCKEFLR
jgi:hypothetical protein